MLTEPNAERHRDLLTTIESTTWLINLFPKHRGPAPHGLTLGACSERWHIKVESIALEGSLRLLSAIATSPSPFPTC